MSRQVAGISLFVLVAIALSVSDASASHFRSATIRWRPDVATSDGHPSLKPNVIVFTFDSVWRKSNFPLPENPTIGVTRVGIGTFTFGDGSFAPMTATVTGYDNANDWVATTWTFTKVYPAVDATYSAQLSNAGRISTLLDGNDDSAFIIRTTVPVTMSAANSSPSSGTLPLIAVPGGAANATFSVPASDPENDPLRFSIAPALRSGLAKAAPDGLSINQSTGVVTWDTRNRTLGLYAVQFLVTDSKGAVVPVDVLLQVNPPSTPTLTPPSMQIDGSTSQTTFTVPIGTTVSFTATGVDPNIDPGTGQPNRFVTLSAAGVPVGASLNPSVPVTLRSPASTTFTWTPAQSQAGNYTVAFGVTTDAGEQATNSATLVVPPLNRAPMITCPAPAAVPFGAVASLAATVADQDADPLTVTWSVSGAGVQTDAVPSSQTPATVVLNRDFGAVGTYVVDVTVTDTSNTSATCSFDVNVVKADTSTTLSSTANPSAFGQPVSVTAIVSPVAPGAGIPSGTVTFIEGATILAGPVAVDPNGLAVLTTSTLPAGAHSITAEYSGSDGYNASLGSIDQVVNKANAAIAVNGYSGVYDAQAHGATGSATGVGGVDLSAGLSLGPTFTSVPGGTAHWTFSGGANYNDAAGDVAIDITPKPAIVAANNRVKEYGDVAIFAGTEFAAAGFIGTDAVNSVTLTSAGAAATAALGPHPIAASAAIGSGLGNYAISYREGALLVRDTTPPGLTVPGAIVRDAVTASGAPVTFTASAADRHDGAVPTTCTPASGSTFPIGVTTVTCTATDTSGNRATASFVVTVSDNPTPGRMHGGGHVMSGAQRYDFNFSVLELSNGRAFGRFTLKVCQAMPSRHGRDEDDFSQYKSRGESDDDDDDGNDHDFAKHERDDEGRCAGRPGRFAATTFAFVRFSNDPAFVPGAGPFQQNLIDTVIYSGEGVWNGVARYRYQVTATDRGEPGRARDTFQVTITAPDGTVVARADGPLTAGNIQSTFIPNLSFLFSLVPR